MISPQELQSKKFEKAVFGGYDMAGVDEFLDVLIPDYTALYKENMTLKNKMKVLVDKIEEYRSVDEEMRKALYAAQVSAKETIQKAQTESDQMLTSAREEADGLLASARAEAEHLLSSAHAEAENRVADMRTVIRTEEQRLEEAQKLSDTYARTVIELLKKNITAMETLTQRVEMPLRSEEPQVAPSAPAVEEELPVFNIQMPEPLPPEATELPDEQDLAATRVFATQPAEEDEDEPLQVYGNRVELDSDLDLKFGKNYQLEDDLKN